MTSTIELSFYPLHEEYPSAVLNFLHLLKAMPGIEIKSNGMSSILIGNFETIWPELGILMKSQLSMQDCVFIMKVAAGRREYED